MSELMKNATRLHLMIEVASMDICGVHASIVVERSSAVASDSTAASQVPGRKYTDEPFGVAIYASNQKRSALRSMIGAGAWEISA
jgi:hypothetical protein